MRNSVRSETARAGSRRVQPLRGTHAKEMSWCCWRRQQIDCRDQCQEVVGPERPSAHNCKGKTRSKNEIAMETGGLLQPKPGGTKQRMGSRSRDQ